VSEVAEYITSKGWVIVRRTRIKGAINFLLDCPLCGAETKKGKNRFVISSVTGVYVCNQCDERGNLYTLRDKMGDLKRVATAGGAGDDLLGMDLLDQLRHPPQPKQLTGIDRKLKEWNDALIGDPVACEWATRSRALPPEALTEFQLGMRMKGSRRWLVLPYFAGGKVVLLKYRSIDGGKDFMRSKDCPSPLFNVDALEGEYKRLYLTEGELDAVSLSIMGFRPAVSLPNGAKNIDDEHAKWLERFDEIYVCTDNDEAGNKSAAMISARLGAFRCFRVLFPLKDANACLAAGMHEDVKTAIGKAVLMASGKLMTGAQALEQAFSNRRALDPGLHTGFTDLQPIIAGWRPYEWTVFSGPTGAGKTALLMSVGTQLILRNVSVMGAWLEIDPEQAIVRWASQIFGTDLYHAGEEVQQKAVERLKEVGHRMSVVPHQGSITMADWAGMVEYGVRRNGVQMHIGDHFQFFCPDVDDNKQVNKDIRFYNDRIVNKTGAHGVMAFHPKTVPTDRKTGEERPIGIGDLYGSVQIKQLAHNAVFLDMPDSKSGSSRVRVAKRRWAGSTVSVPASFTLRFSKKSLMYVDDDDNENIDFADYQQGGKW